MSGETGDDILDTTERRILRSPPHTVAPGTKKLMAMFALLPHQRPPTPSHRAYQLLPRDCQNETFTLAKLRPGFTRHEGQC
jgi:hypothetical protein